MNMKKSVAKTLVVAAVAGALMVPAAATDAAENAITVTVDNKAVVWEDATPFIQDNRTLVPLRAAAEAMGLEVDWDGAAKCASFSASYKPTQKWMDEIKQDEPQMFLTQTTVKMYANQDSYEAVNVWTVYDANGNTVDVQEEVLPLEMDSAVVMKDNRTYAPIRYVAERFGYEVGWDAESRTVQIADAVDSAWKGELYYAAGTDAENAGGLILAVGDLENIASLTIQSATIQNVTAEDEAAALNFVQLSEEDTKAFQKAQADLTIEADLVAYGAETAIAADQQYNVVVSMEIVKSNGIVETPEVTFQINAPEAEEAAN